MSDLSDLIARVEAASAGSRDLDADIYEAFGHEVLRRPKHIRGIAWKYRPGHGHWLTMERLTTSVDAALSILPSGCHYTIEPDGAWIRCMSKDDVDEFQCVLLHRGGECTALALCAAILKARQASNGDRHAGEKGE